jgi:hypothetical protein
VIVNVRMLANHDGNSVVRPVKVGYTDGSLLDGVFYYGQNEFCDDENVTSKFCSVSVGDVIELPYDGDNYIVLPCGFYKLTDNEYDTYMNLPREDRWMAAREFSN